MHSRVLRAGGSQRRGVRRLQRRRRRGDAEGRRSGELGRRRRRARARHGASDAKTRSGGQTAALVQGPELSLEEQERVEPAAVSRFSASSSASASRSVNLLTLSLSHPVHPISRPGSMRCPLPAARFVSRSRRHRPTAQAESSRSRTIPRRGSSLKAHVLLLLCYVRCTPLNQSRCCPLP